MRGVAAMAEKPAFTQDQIAKSSEAAKKFGEIRQKAKKEPQIIIHNGQFDLAILDYQVFERLLMRLQDLEAQIGGERLERPGANPGGLHRTAGGRRLGLEKE